jgi:hypothetical protein
MKALRLWLVLSVAKTLRVPVKIREAFYGRDYGTGLKDCS